MRTVIYGVLVLAAAGAMALDWSKFEQVAEPQAEMIRLGILMAVGVLGVIVLMDGVISSATRNGDAKSAAAVKKDLESKLTELGKQNQDLVARASSSGQLEQEVQALTARKRELETALQASKDQLARAQQAAKKDDEGHKDVIAFLSVLQKKGRLIDFLMDDISAYPDPQVGAAARIVHQGCASVLKDYFAIEPIHRDKEGAAVTFESDIDGSHYRILGKADGKPPFNGKLIHHGWKTGRVTIPKSTVGLESLDVIAPAEVELG